MRKYKANLVSVIIPTYKRSSMLERAINSVLSQSYDFFELLIINDNYPGDEWSNQVENRVNSFNDKRIRFINQDIHINGAAARNVGIKNATGEYIAFLDDDDYFDAVRLVGYAACCAACYSQVDAKHAT